MAVGKESIKRAASAGSRTRKKASPAAKSEEMKNTETIAAEKKETAAVRTEEKAAVNVEESAVVSAKENEAVKAEGETLKLEAVTADKEESSAAKKTERAASKTKKFKTTRTRKTSAGEKNASDNAAEKDGNNEKPVDSGESQAVFTPKEEGSRKHVRFTEELPVYLL